MLSNTGILITHMMSMNCSNLGLSEYWTVYSLKFCSRPFFIMPFSTFIYIPVPLLEKTATLVFINLFSV